VPTTPVPRSRREGKVNSFLTHGKRGGQSAFLERFLTIERKASGKKNKRRRGGKNLSTPSRTRGVGEERGREKGQEREEVGERNHNP